MVTTVGGVQIEIRGDPSSFQRSMRDVQRDASRTGQVIERDFGKADRAIGKMDRSIKGAATSMLALGAAIGVGAGLSGGIRLIADFSQAMSTLQAITQGTTEQMEALKAVANELGATTRYSATQAADAMTELARSGFTVNQVLAAIGPTLSAAQAGGAGIAETAAIIGATIGGFGLAAEDAARIADVLAQAANGSAAGILDLGEALKFAAPTAKQLGLGLEETVALIGKLSDGGITGGLAGRGFQSLATQLVNEKGKIEELIGTYDLATDGLGSVLARLREAGITTGQIIEIFRAENLDTFGILSDAALNGNLAKLNGLLDEAAGSSAKAAKVMDDNLNGAILNASSAFEGLVLAIADAGVEDGLRDAFKGLSSLLTLAAENVDVLGVAIVAISANALIPMAVRAVPQAITALQGLAVALTTTQTAATRMAAAGALLGGPLTLGILAASAAYLVLARNAETAEQRLARANDALANAKAVLGDTQALLADGNSPFEKIASQASDAAGEVVTLTGALDGLATGIKNLREEGQIAAALRLGEAIAQTDASIRELEAARTVAVNRAVGNTPNLGGRAGLDRIAANAGSNFDQSEQGKALLFLRQQRAALQTRLGTATQGLTATDLINQFRNGSPASTAGGGAAEVAAQATATGDFADETERLAEAQLDLQDILDDADAVFQGQRDAASLQRVDQFNLNRVERDRNAEEAARAAQAFRDRVAETISGALEQGIRTGNWGQAFRDILAQSTSDALSEAINDLATELVSLFSSAFSGAGSTLGSSIASLFSFGGARAGGGPVKPGSRYMVGEQGPEMFVPSVPGVIVPKTTLPASGGLGAMSGGAVSVNAPLIVQGSITEEVLPRVQAMMAAQARELPRIVNTVIEDGRRRGRY